MNRAMSQTSSQASPQDSSQAPLQQALLALLDLDPVSSDTYGGWSPREASDRVYGGQPLAQALIAAAHTVEAVPARFPHSLHGYFLRAGSTKLPIMYEVERLRDGRSFSTRRVVAKQQDTPIFVCTISFHVSETGLDHQTEAPRAPSPEGLKNFNELSLEGGEAPLEEPIDHPIRSVDMRPVSGLRYVLSDRDATPQMWMRTDFTLPDDPVIHRAVIAYMSDSTLLSEALRPHGHTWHDPDMQMASLDHALWFHREVRADEWLLYAQGSPSGSGARGFCLGSIYTRTGLLAASVAQEGLMRQRTRSKK